MQLIVAQDIAVILPEMTLAIYAMMALMWGVFSRSAQTASAIIWITALAFLALAVWMGFSPEGTRTAFSGAFTDDFYARFAKITILASMSVLLVMSREYLERSNLLKFEFPALIAFAVLGMMMMVSASDLMLLYMGLELQSLALYVLASFHRDSARSTEAGVKYFVLGALSSGILLFGASFVYGYSGTTLFSGIAASAENEMSFGLLYGLIFILVGLAFKISAAPFHMWAPDVYDGAPTPVTAIFATAPKVAALMLLARLLFEAFGAAQADWQMIIAVLSVASMFLGAIAAIGQTDIKRLMAYSSISHMGYALAGLAAANAEGLRSMLVYLVIYVIMNLGTFAFILSMRRDGRQVTLIAGLNLYSRQAPARALSLLVLLFSLAGIVPMVGFFTKFYVFLAVMNADLLWLAIAGAIASVIGAYYYLRIVYLMYFGQEAEQLDAPMSVLAQSILLVAALAMVVGVINLFMLNDFAGSAVQALLG